MPDRNLHLTVLDQSMGRFYGRTLLFFPFKNSAHVNGAISTLTNALQKTLGKFPFLAGTVGPVNPQTGTISAKYPYPVPNVLESGLFKATLECDGNPDIEYHRIRGEGMPPSRFASLDFCPDHLRYHPHVSPGALNGATTPLEDGSIPILAVQAYFVQGGLILSIYNHHSLLDGTGIGIFLRTWSENVRCDRERVDVGLSTDAQISSKKGLKLFMGDLEGKTWHPGDNSDTTKDLSIPGPSAQRLALDALIPRADANIPPPFCPELTTIQRKIPIDPTRVGPIKIASTIFTIPASAITSLRTSLSSQLTHNISTFTVLAALLWVHATRARGLLLLDKGFEKTTLCFMADIRRHLGLKLEDEYMGNAALKVTATIPLSTILSTSPFPASIAPILFAATAIYKSLSSLNKHWVLDRLHLLSTLQSPRDVRPSFTTSRGADIFVTSWQHIGAEDVWNIPGAGSAKPEFVRGPWVGDEGGIVILPRRDGSGDTEEKFEVLVMLEEGDMARFEAGMRELGWVDRVVV